MSNNFDYIIEIISKERLVKVSSQHDLKLASLKYMKMGFTREPKVR